MINVWVLGKSGLNAGLIGGHMHWKPRIPLMAAYGDGTVGAVELIPYVQVPPQFLKVWKDIGVRP